MSSFICEKCGYIDNTACGGNYWEVVTNRKHYKEEYYNTHIVCSECCPTHFKSGAINEDGGKWEKHFPKVHWSKRGTKEELIKLCKEKEGNIINAEEYFETGVIHKDSDKKVYYDWRKKYEIENKLRIADDDGCRTLHKENRLSELMTYNEALRYLLTCTVMPLINNK